MQIQAILYSTKHKDTADPNVTSLLFLYVFMITDGSTAAATGVGHIKVRR